MFVKIIPRSILSTYSMYDNNIIKILTNNTEEYNNKSIFFNPLKVLKALLCLLTL